VFQQAIQFVGAVFVGDPQIGGSSVKNDIKVLATKCNGAVVLSVLVVVNSNRGRSCVQSVFLSTFGRGGKVVHETLFGSHVGHLVERNADKVGGGGSDNRKGSDKFKHG